MCLFVLPKTTDFGDTEGHKSRFLSDFFLLYFYFLYELLEK
ncbi:hypothetical protein bcere0027_8700 [Bacillus cereus AH676]|nr:hypothetical protein bcere0015_8460 [Bacillus cereus BDRD-Cer4]EEL77750.1 hypothetical protein bcere0027_8700 [Bacillus cereus AH676]EEM49194.1 hypothetical protein bthur0005_8750 [Bacillus thuringiensis serovar pakistani str. T13001]KZD85860.1 hypothetical protein B4155_1404 [Bacillus cereus]QBZ24027.1 hypothetical protein FORC085_958 [Bacillus cereus]